MKKYHKSGIKYNKSFIIDLFFNEITLYPFKKLQRIFKNPYFGKNFLISAEKRSDKE